MRTIATILIILALFVHQSSAQESIRIGLSLTTEANEHFDLLMFGIDPNATLGIDTALGERDYPGYPIQSLHAFIIIIDPQTNEEYYSYKNFKPFPKDSNKYYTEYKFEFNPYIGDTITVRWGTLPVYVDSAYFVKPYAGTDLFSINMKENQSYSFFHRDLGTPTNALFKVWFSKDPSGIEETAEGNVKISLFPNPAIDVLTLQNIHSQSTYTIYNLLGEVVWQGTFDYGINQINIQNFQSGYYIIKIVDNNGNQSNTGFLKK